MLIFVLFGDGMDENVCPLEIEVTSCIKVIDRKFKCLRFLMAICRISGERFFDKADQRFKQPSL